MRLTKFRIAADRESVFNVLSIDVKSPVYAQSIKAYGRCYAKFEDTAKPIALYELYEEKTGESPYGVYVVITLGEAVTQAVTEYFEKGEYLCVMIYNAICDNYLMKLDESVKKHIANDISHKGLSIKEYLYPHEELPPEDMERIISRLKGEDAGVSVNSAYALKPVKSMAYIIAAGCGSAQHSLSRCIRCKNKDCRYKKA